MNLLKLNYFLLLLCTNCLVVWADFQDTDVFVNRYIEDIDDSVSATFCAHDGFLNDTCQCGTDYAGATCQTRQCRNFGIDGLSFLKTDRCLCPPGFLGRNCEPVRCIEGSKAIFQQSEKTIALLATTNIHMNQSWTTDNPVTLLCKYTNYTRIFSLGGFMMKVDPNAATCNPKSLSDPCTDSVCSPLELSAVYDLVVASPPNTIVFVLSNQPMNSSAEDIPQKIIATAIAKRIQINVILYEMISDEHTLDILRNIATSTVGSFVKKGYESDSPGVDQQYQVIQNLLQNFDNGIHIAALGVDKSLPLQVNSDIYVSGQVDFGKTLDISTSNDQGFDIIVDTTYWKLYRLNASSLNWIRVTGQTPGTTVLIQTKDRLRAYSAFTIDDGWVDGMFPTAIAETSYPLVLRFENDANVLGFDDIRLITTLSTSSNFNVSTSFYTRVDCQFNFKLASACSSADVIFLYILSSSNKPTLLPISCVDKNFGEQVYNSFLSPSSIVGESFVHQSFVKDAVCGPEPTVNKFGDHSFAIISPNSTDDNQTRSSVDNLYRNRNSVFYQLYDYLQTPSNQSNQNQYSNFVGSLYGSDKIDNIAVENEYEYFLTNIMSMANLAPIHTEGTVDIVTHIFNTLQNPNLKPFSDVFVIVDSPIKNDTDQAQMLNLIQTTRVRLLIIYVSTYSSLADSDYIFLNDISSRSSGGLLTVVNDYSGVKNFFTTYMKQWVDSNMVANGYSIVPRAGIVLNDVNLMKYGEYYLLVTNRDSNSLSNGNVNVTVNLTGGSWKAIPEFIGDIQRFLLSISTTASFNISISGFAQLTNVILLESMKLNQYVGLTFVNNQNVLTNSIGYNLNGFQPLIYSSFDFNATDAKFSITQLTDVDPFALVYKGSIINQTSCDPFENFKYSTDFNWVCSQAGGLYRVKIDLSSSNGTYSRTFPLTCITSTASKCLNGGSPDDNGNCICALGWGGDVCQTPVCLNGGTQTSGNTCQCLSTFSGSHCETSSSTCQNSTAAPAFRSDLSSLIIVAETNALKDVYLTSGVTIPGVPITVVKYKGSQADIVLTTTDGTLLNSVLNQNVDPDEVVIESTAQNLNNALNVALNYQNTDRSLVVVLTSQNDFSVDPDTLIRLAARRSEVRFLTTTNAVDSLTTLSLIGNSIPIYIQDSTFLQSFFDTYVAGVFTRTKSQKVFNVYLTDTVNGSLAIVIPADDTDSSTDNTIILHVFNGSWVTDEKNPTTIKSGSYNLYIFDNIAPTVDFSLTLKPTTENVKLYYSIERINYLSTAYGFSSTTDGSNEQLVAGARIAQNNVLSIYTSPLPSTLPSSNPLQLPYLEIRQILDGNMDSPQTILLTRKPATCLYTHFVALDICKDSSVLGYQIRLNTRTSRLVTKQQQFTLTCHNTVYSNGDTSCGGYGSPLQTCNCDTGYTGIDCREPICENGVRDGSICRCPVPYYGKRCELLNEDYFNAQAVAFVLDLVGADDFAYNETINTVTEYVKDCENDLYVMIIANVDPIYKTFQIFDAENLSVFLDSFYKQRHSTTTSNLTDALTQIANNLDSLQNVTLASKNIFYLTQVGLAADDNVASVLLSLSDFERSAVVYSPFNTIASSSIGTSLSPFTTNVRTMNNYYDATNYLISITGSGKFTTPVNPNRSCAYGIQANIIVALDVSKTDAANADDKKNEILSLLRNKFNYINSDVNRCTANVDIPEFYNERTIFSIFTIYDQGFISGRFCPSNYDSATVANYAGSETTPEFTTKQLERINSFVNNNANCSCSRTYSSNSDTSKFLIWMPRAYTKSTPGRLANMTYTFDNSAQFVIPFYDIDTNSTSDDLYYTLLEQNKLGTQTPADYILPNAVNTDAQAIVDALEKKMCKLANVPGSD